ncbi:ribosomal small subunit pseudouridine synthase A [Lachnospiraceae bacterium KM106-2]|nr:ribosomal small subunit pseudouridine synthase A [Lachnospiraceae bacterium KM106-2]
MRLDKYLIQASIGMRKEVQPLIREGLVTVNGNVVTVPETIICEKTDCITYRGEKISLGKRQYYMLHKPAGYITARSDAEKATVLDLFQNVNTNSLFPVGRLDKDTEGLLFLTNDGAFDQFLMNPKCHVEKTYFFWALGSLSEEDKAALCNGLSIGEGEKLTKPARLTIVREGLYDVLKEEIISPIICKVKMKPEGQPVVAGYLTISEGRKHQVKRMLKAVGCYIIYLKRTTIGPVALDESLPKGQYRALSEEEVRSLLD